MGEDGFGLGQEGVDGLGWAAADEILQGSDELRPLGVHLRGEAPREDPVDHHLGHASKGPRHAPSAKSHPAPNWDRANPAIDASALARASSTRPRQASTVACTVSASAATGWLPIIRARSVISAASRSADRTSPDHSAATVA